MHYTLDFGKDTRSDELLQSSLALMVTVCCHSVAPSSQPLLWSPCCSSLFACREPARQCGTNLGHRTLRFALPLTSIDERLSDGNPSPWSVQSCRTRHRISRLFELIASLASACASSFASAFAFLAFLFLILALRILCSFTMIWY